LEAGAAVSHVALEAYLFGGVEIRWRCAPELIEPGSNIPAEAVLRFPGGLKDYLAREIEGKEPVTEQAFTGKIEREGGHGSLEWAVSWLANDDGFVHSYAIPFRRPTAARMRPASVSRYCAD